MKIVVKGWQVRAQTKEKSEPAVVSRKYHVREAADLFSAEYRKISKYPDSVYVEAITGPDGVD
jgi:hypothetical protein